MESGLVTSDGTKALTVEEYDRLKAAIHKTAKAMFEVDVITGLRYVEIQRLYENPHWYLESRNQIILPKEAQKKVKQHQVKRTIDRLPSTFPYIFKAFLEGRKPPESSAWNRDLGRWSKIAGINPKASPKTPRKTIENWMLKTGVLEIEIYSRAGHDPVTSLRHYQSLSFTDYELRDIKKRLTEWGILNN